MRRTEWLRWFLLPASMLVATLLLAIFLFLLYQCLPFLSSIPLSEISQSDWYPLAGSFGMLPMIFASLAIAIGAMLMAIPVSIAIVLWARFYTTSVIRRLYYLLLEVLSAIPSVVFGLWGIIFLVPLLANWVPPGMSLIAGVTMLSLVLIPVLILVIDQGISQIPKTYLASAKMLNISTKGYIKKIVLKLSMPSIVAGSLLQSGRALGETIIVLMVCGNVVQIPTAISDPVRTLTSNIALEMGYATNTHQSALFFTGLMMLVISACCIAFAHIMLNRDAANA